MSAPPERLTGVYEPKLPQVPPDRVASARSTTPLAESTPEPESEPLPSVSGTDSVV